MSKIGVYRWKQLITENETPVTLYVNGVVACVHTVKTQDICPNGVRLKYLDSCGQYRFIRFNPVSEIKSAPKPIGNINKLVTSILEDGGATHNVGVKDAKKIMVKVDMTEDELDSFAQIYDSPRVYYYIGSNNSDNASSWLEVDITISTPIHSIKKGRIAVLELTIQLPEQNTIKML